MNDLQNIPDLPARLISSSVRVSISLEALPPFLRTLLITDGTVTKSLEAYFWEPVVVENLFQEAIRLHDDLKIINLEAGKQVLKREVRLKGVRTATNYVYARSFIRLDALPAKVADDLLAGKIGIGELLRESELETFRELIEIGQEELEEANTALGGPDMNYLFRSYRINTRGEPAILIQEYFPLSVYQDSSD